MAHSVDFMIAKSRARPPEGMEVLVRLKDNHIMHGTYESGKFFGVPHEDVVSWLPSKMKNPCACEKLRWKPKSRQSGTCNKCGIKWKKQLDKSTKLR